MPEKATCEFCGVDVGLLRCRSHGTFACAQHIPILRRGYGYNHGQCTFEPWDTHITTYTSASPVIQPDPVKVWAEYQMRLEEMRLKANNAKEALAEGKTFARLFGGLVQKKPNPDFETLADFAQMFSQNILNYTAADLANGWAKGFISEWTAQPKVVDPTTKSGLEQINLMRSWLGMPPLEEPPPMLEASNGE